MKQDIYEKITNCAFRKLRTVIPLIPGQSFR